MAQPTMTSAVQFSLPHEHTDVRMECEEVPQKRDVQGLLNKFRIVTTPIVAANRFLLVLRKRHVQELRNKFRIVTTSIVAANRFLLVLQSHNAQAEDEADNLQAVVSLAKLNSPPGDNLVDPNAALLCTKYQKEIGLEAEGEINTPRNAYDGYQSIGHRGMFGAEEEEDRRVLQYYSGKSGARVGLSGQIESGIIASHNPYNGFPCNGNQGIFGPELEQNQRSAQVYFPAGREGIGLFGQAEGIMSYVPNVSPGLTSTGHQFQDVFPVGHGHHELFCTKESGQYEQAYPSAGPDMAVREIENFLDEPEVAAEALQNPDKDDSGLFSDWRPLHNLLKMDGNSPQWNDLGTELMNTISEEIIVLASGSGRDKVDKLIQNAEEIPRKIGEKGSRYRPKKHTKVSSTTPTVTDSGATLSAILDSLQSKVTELFHGRPEQLLSLFGLIQDVRTVLHNLELVIEWILDKAKKFVRDLKFRQLDVEKHFQNCSTAFSALVPSVVERRRRNFLSVATLCSWYFEEMNNRPTLQHSTTQTSVDGFSNQTFSP